MVPKGCIIEIGTVTFPPINTLFVVSGIYQHFYQTAVALIEKIHQEIMTRIKKKNK